MHIVSGYIGSFTFFLFEGDGASQAIQRTWVQRTFSMERVASAAPRREEAKPCVILSEHSGWQGNILEFSFIFSATEECPYQSLLTSSTWSVDNPALQYMGWASQARLWPGETVHPREGDTKRKKKSETSISSTARDFQLDSHVTSLVTWGKKLVMKQPPPYCH